jgi:Domain of unknown function (DUF4838)
MTMPDKRSRRAIFRSIGGLPLLSLASRVSAESRLTLAAGGASSYSIFLSPSASPSEHWAAEDLRRHLGTITGAVLPIVIGDDRPLSDAVIAVGRSAVTDACGVDPPSGESSTLQTVGKTLIVAGGRQRGTMYGVYALLEKLGCRWFTPDIAAIPRTASLPLPDLAEHHSPAFEYREVFYTEALGREWSARNRLNGNFHQLDGAIGGKISFYPFAHSFYDLVPPDRHFDSHPEYFALVAGRRRPERTQLCLTNDEVVRLAVGGVFQWIADNPDISTFSVSPNDGGSWCECGPCRRVIEDEGGATSGLLLRFVNRVAERIGDAHPGKCIDTLAYLETFRPPSKVRPRANVQIRLCPIQACQAHSYSECPYDESLHQALMRWSQVAPRLYLWLYGTNFSHYLFPFPNYDALASNVRQLQRAGVSGVFVQGAGSGGGSAEDAELHAYLAARLLWDPGVDVQREIRRFLNTVYGPAADLMSRYFALRSREVHHGKHLWIDQEADAPYLSSAFLKTARSTLGRARNQAATAAARRRVERCLLSIDYVDVLRSRRFLLRDGSYSPKDINRVRANTQTLVANAERLGVVQFREGYSLQRHAKDFEALMRNYATVSLSDGASAATIVPDLEARVALLKRSDREENVLRVPSPGEWAYPRSGGLFVRLHTNYLSSPVPIDWRTENAGKDFVELNGVSTHGLVLTLSFRLARGVLCGQVTVENPSSRAIPVALRWHAEFPLHAAPIADENVVFTDGQLSRGEGTLFRAGFRFKVQNRFPPEQAGRWTMENVFRGEAHSRLSLWSPEVQLTSGRRLTLASEYRLID